MNHILDDIDRRLLCALQRDAAQSLDTLSDQAGLSRNACWRRIKRLEETGVIRSRVALLDPAKVGLGLMVLIAVRTRHHYADWAARFLAALRGFPEILAAWRTSGDTDYMLQARVADVTAYDRLYQRLIAKIDLEDVSASFVMEELKGTTELPL
jgi:Lrp/AsnC family transcriptional regulator